jgi:DNA replication protein DnaC
VSSAIAETFAKIANGRPLATAEQPRYPEGWCVQCNAAPCRCAICHGAGWVLMPGPTPSSPRVSQQCECRRREMAAFAAAELADISVLPSLADRRFTTFNPHVPGMATAHAAALAYAENPLGWLVLHGPTGCGKTHLVAAVGNAIADRGEAVALFVTPDFLAELRRCFGKDDNGRPKDDGRYQRLVDAAKSAPILILDDLGAQRDTDWAVEQIYAIVDARYREWLPLVVTTNTLVGIEPRVKSRLCDEGLSVVVTIKAEDYRRIPAKHRRQMASEALL